MNAIVEEKTMEVKSESKKKRIGFLAFLFTVIYVFLECTFNIGLVDATNSPNTEIETFNHLETLGRVLSSLGFAIFIVNIFKVRRFVYSLILLVIFSGSFYGLQNYTFNKILDNMSRSAKVQAYSLGVYRNLAINSEISTPDSIYNEDNKYYNDILNSTFGIILFNPDLNDKVSQYTTDFFEVNLSIPNEELESIFDKISALKNNEYSEELWKQYVIENKRFNNYHGFFKEAYERKFEETLGLKPNLTKEDFLSAIQNKQGDMDKIDEVVIVPANQKLGIEPLYLKDIPSYIKEKNEWVNYVQKHVEKQVGKLKLSEENIDNLPHSRDIISSVVIVPIAVILSLVSIILNTCILVSVFHRVIGYMIGIVAIIIVLVHSFMMNYYSLPFWANGAIHLEKYSAIALNPYRSFLHAIFINDEEPNRDNIIKIEKPEVPNFDLNYSELINKFEDFNRKTSEFEGQQSRKDLNINEEKLEDQGYYGEVNKENPYLK